VNEKDMADRDRFKDLTITAFARGVDEFAAARLLFGVSSLGQ
jgi:hypothetical protein